MPTTPKPGSITGMLWRLKPLFAHYVASKAELEQNCQQNVACACEHHAVCLVAFNHARTQSVHLAIPSHHGKQTGTVWAHSEPAAT